MSAVLTERTNSAHGAARETLSRGLDDLGVSHAQLAGAVERSPSKIAQWVSGAAHAPLYLLAHPLVPEALRARLRALSPVAAPVVVPCETTTGLLIAEAGSALHTLGRAMSDGSVSRPERALARPLIQQLRDRCDQWLARHGADE